MKKAITAIAIVAMIIIAGMSQAIELPPVNLVSGITSTITGTGISLYYGMKDVSVDVSPGCTGACTVVVRIDGNATGDNTFDTSGIGSSITCTTARCTAGYSTKALRGFRAVVTSVTGTASATVTMTGTQ